MNEASWEAQWVPHEQVPAFKAEGWRIVENETPVHHDYYSVLMERKVGECR